MRECAVASLLFIHRLVSRFALLTSSSMHVSRLMHKARDTHMQAKPRNHNTPPLEDELAIDQLLTSVCVCVRLCVFVCVSVCSV